MGTNNELRNVILL